MRRTRNEPKGEFIMKNSVQNAGCAFTYFCGGHKNNLRLWFRSSFKNGIIFCKNSCDKFELILNMFFEES